MKSKVRLFGYFILFSIIIYGLLFYFLIITDERLNHHMPRNHRKVSDEAETTQTTPTTPTSLQENVYYRSEPLDIIVLSSTSDEKSQEIVIAMAACGRLNEAFNMIKSAIVFTESPLQLLIFTEQQYVTELMDTLETWRNITNNSFRFVLYKITYPDTEDAVEWKKLVTPCASQRLFFPIILPDVDSLLFVDTDILFLRPVEEMWNQFSLMTETEELAAVQENVTVIRNKVGGHDLHPYFGANGINAGVLMMNLTRMRASDWTTVITGYYHEYKPYLASGDQDLVDIYMHFHPGRVKILNVRYNFRPRFCTSEWRGVERVGSLGVAVLHGTGSKFYLETPAYITIFNCWTDYILGTDPYVNLYQHMKYSLKTAGSSICMESSHIFLQGLSALNPH